MSNQDTLVSKMDYVRQSNATERKEELLRKTRQLYMSQIKTKEPKVVELDD